MSSDAIAQVLDDAEDPILILDPSGRPLHANPAARHALGATWDGLRLAIEPSGAISRLSWRRSDGEEEDCLASITETRWRGGPALLALLRPAANGPAEEGARLKVLLEQMVDGVAVFDAHRRLTLFNRHFISLLNLDPDKIKPGRTLDAILGDMIADGEFGAVANPEQAIEKYIGQLWEHRSDRWERQRPTGQWIEIQRSITTDGGVLIIFSDITERKRLEFQVLDQTVRIQGVLNSMMDAVVTIDARGRIDFMNRKAELVFGWLLGEVAGKNVAVLMPEPFASEHDRYLDNYHRTGVAHVIGIGREVVGKRKDGSLFPCDLIVSEMREGDTELFDDDGLFGDVEENRLYIGVLRDISDRKKAESALLSAKSQAEMANRAKSEFLSTITHELRTPLNAIMGYADMMANAMVSGEEVPVYAADIYQNGQQLLNLIDGILDMARIESGQYDLMETEVDIAQLATDAVNLVSASAEEAGLVIANVASDIHAFVLADERALSQVLLNILSNAIKFTPAGGGVSVRAYIEETGDLVVAIADSGCGIDSDHLEHIFEPFRQADMSNARAHGGVGLGLTLSKNLMELHGGAIRIDSALGVGSTVFLRLPEHRVINPADAPAAPDYGVDDPA